MDHGHGPAFGQGTARVSLPVVVRSKHMRTIGARGTLENSSISSSSCGVIVPPPNYR